MKRILLCFFFLSGCTHEKAYRVPDAWPADFSIKLYEGGGMRSGSTTVVFNFDSVEFTRSFRDTLEHYVHALAESERTAILQTLTDLHIERIKVKEKPFETDQETTSMCFLTKGSDDFCLDSGSAHEFVDPEGSFGKAWVFLMAKAKSTGKEAK